MSIALEQVTKRYHATPVVNDVSLEVASGEFFVLLGPSGSGKSTLLRAIAGLTGIDRGRIDLHGRDVTRLPVRKREVGFVFQNYALFRHMSVAENIEFALRVRRMGRADRLKRRRQLLRLVALEGMDARLPTQLSGGQQQRIAVARALAHEPGVLLMDEPFGALDAKIRDELRRTIRKVQRELGITTILVTHDQEEAFALADRIGVMHQGRLLEVGEPETLYARPATRFVATFLGAANLLLLRRAGQSGEVVAVVRPEDVTIAANQDDVTGRPIGHGRVEELTFAGAIERLRVRAIPAQEVAAASRRPSEVSADGILLEVLRSQADRRALPLAVGSTVHAGAKRMHVLDTPIASFTIVAAQAAEAETLLRSPLLTRLVEGMQAPVATELRALDEDRSSSAAVHGVVVLQRSRRLRSQVQRLLTTGAAGVLVLPVDCEIPTRVLVHASTATARHGTLRIAASIVRHIAAEAVYFGGEAADHAAGLEELHEVRALARERHGLDLRTELGDPVDAPLAPESEAVAGGRLVIIGCDNLAQSDAWLERMEASAIPDSWLFVLDRSSAQRQYSLPLRVASLP